MCAQAGSMDAVRGSAEVWHYLIKERTNNMKQFTYDKALPEGRAAPKSITPWRIVKILFIFTVIILWSVFKACLTSNKKTKTNDWYPREYGEWGPRVGNWGERVNIWGTVTSGDDDD